MAITTVVVVSTPFILSMALMGEPTNGVQSPAQVIQSLDNDALAGDWTAAHQNFAYEYRGRALFPDAWATATLETKSAFITLWQPQFRLGWERTRGADALREANWSLSETSLADGRTLVEQTLVDGKKRITLRYWLLRQGTRWRVVDRTYLVDGVEHSGTRVVLKIWQKIGQQLGRDPSLADFVANAPSWIGRVRTKSFRLP